MKYLIASILLICGVVAQAADFNEPEEERGLSRHTQPRPSDQFCVRQAAHRPVVSDQQISKCEKDGGQIMTRGQIANSDDADLKDALSRVSL